MKLKVKFKQSHIDFTNMKLNKNHAKVNLDGKNIYLNRFQSIALACYLIECSKFMKDEVSDEK